MDAHLSLYTRETGEYVQIQGNYIGQNNNKLLAYSRRGEQCSPVRKCDTYGIIVLFADYKFIISTKDKIQIERLIFKRDINDVPYNCNS